MRRMISWLYGTLSILIIVCGLIALPFKVTDSKIVGPLIIGDFLLLSIVALVSVLCKKGAGATFQARYSVIQVYKIGSILLIVVGVAMMMIANNELMIARNQPGVYFSVGSGIIADILLLWTITFISRMRQGGKHSLIRFLRSTRFRLTLWYVMLLAVILLIFSTIIYTSFEIILHDSLAADMNTRLSQVAGLYDAQTNRLAWSFSADQPRVRRFEGKPSKSNLEAPDVVLLLTPEGEVLQGPENISGGDIGAVKKQIDQVLQKEEENSFWQKRSEQQLVLGPAGRPMTGYTPGVISSAPLHGDMYVFIGAVIENPQLQPVAYLIVGMPDSTILPLRNLLLLLAVVTPLVLLLSSAGGYWLANRAMRPVQTITRTVQAIGETDLHRRLKLKQRDELGELGATFDGMLDRLEAAFERQRQFTADASHELRTPLSIVDLEAERALKHELSAEEYRRTIGVMQQENRHMARLVNDLLLLARADSGRARLKCEEIDLSEVVLDTVERLAPLAQQSELTIEMAALPEFVVTGDRLYLGQLVTNIVENALKYSAGVGSRVDIELVEREKQGQAWAVLRVTDDGPGIEPEHVPHIFERFYRVDQVRTHSQGEDGGGWASGSGLGLSIARWIAQAHGGAIQVQSEVGQGTTFEVWVPRAT